jgi:hypothetical protein
MVLYFCNILKTVREIIIFVLEMHSQHNNASLCENSTKSQLVKLSLRCTTTKHGYQSKRTYGKVVRKHKMDSYIVG